ncbi:FkbM family methyltransferase [Burkholderiales bacterium]|nr:FkbM family methyltransferase [Burkholderiales bacterium]
MTFRQTLQFISRFRRAYLSPTKALTSYSQCAEDLIVKMFLQVGLSKAKGYYVDVGCHHPRRGSNTFGFYKAGWNGILIDMEEDKVRVAKMARKRDLVVQSAISDRVETLNIYSPGEFSTNATIDPEVVAQHPEYRRVNDITTETLTEILDRCDCPKKFEFLNIDCEGNDFRVLKGLSLRKYEPKVICIEIWESKTGLDDMIASDIHQHLVSLDYELRSWAVFSAIYVKAAVS